MDHETDQFFEAFIDNEMNDIDIDSLTAHSDIIGLDRIHDFKPYNESEIFDISEEFYLNKGIKAWSNSAAKIVPHKVGSNYQSALAFAKMVKANLKQYSWNDHLNILECGAGSGRFARHLLYALEELGIQKRCTVLISDYSKQNLMEIRDSNMLHEFEENDHYRFIEFDVVKSIRGTTLEGKRFNLNNIAAVHLHYVLDSLPLTYLRNQASKQEELYLSVFRRKDQVYDVMENDFFQARLEFQEEWRDYNWQEQSEPEIYYQEFIESNYQFAKGEFAYPYVALRAIDNISRQLDHRAFILSSDLLQVPNKRYAVVGNAVTHPLDVNALLAWFKEQGDYGTTMIEDNKNLTRLVLTKSRETYDSIEPVFKQAHVIDDQITRYLQMEKALAHLSQGSDPGSFLTVLREFTKLAPYCSNTYKLWSAYYKMIGKDSYSGEALDKAKRNDYWQDL